MKKPADTTYPINEFSRERWSPRAFADIPVEPEHVAALLECARWAPSAGNEQPWRFLIGFRGDGTWEKLFSTLTGWNRQWAGMAPVLLLVTGKEKTGARDKVNEWFAYDCGQAMAHITVEAARLGLFTHQMGGFSAEQAVELFSIPPGYRPLTVMAIGYYGNPQELPEELREREVSPRMRKEMGEIVFSGRFGDPAGIV